MGTVEGIILDLDGVVYRGSELIPGAKEFLDFLERSGRRVVALTNHAGETASFYAEKLGRFGIEFPEERIVTSAWATARYLQETAPDASVYVLGSRALKESLAAAGLVALETPERVDYVVAGFDAELSFAKLSRATTYLLNGAALIGTNPDALLPTPVGPVPECGPLLAFLEAAAGREPTVIGKPNPHFFERALERLGTARENTLVVGDTLETDIAGGRAAGLRTALVLTGNTSGAPLRAATVVVDDLQELTGVLS